MDYITTTQLRTKSKDLVKALHEGRVVDLIHRSKVVGVIKAKIEPKPLTEEGIQKIREAAKKLNLLHLSYKERERRYRKLLKMKFFGKMKIVQPGELP